MNTHNFPKPIDWDYLLDKIREEECLLILGHEAFANVQGETAHSRLLQSLDLQKKPGWRNVFQ